jgi:hypothetical protein
MSEGDNANGAGADGGSGDGTLPVAAAGGFVDSLAPEFREAVSKTGITDANGLAKAYLEAQSFMGTSIRIPGVDAGKEDIAKFDARLAEKVPGLVRLPGDGDAEGWKTFHQRLGVPSAPTEYKFSAVEGIPEEIGNNLDQWFAPIAHKANLTPGQATAVRKEWLGSVQAAGEAAESAQTAAADALRTEWGAGYEQRLARAMGTLVPVLGADKAAKFKTEVEAVGLGNAPMLFQLLDRVADYVGEDRFVPGQRPNHGLPDTMTELESKIAEIQKNPAYGNRLDPAHKSLLAKMEALFNQKAALQERAA